MGERIPEDAGGVDKVSRGQPFEIGDAEALGQEPPLRYHDINGGLMAQLVVRNLDDDVKVKLQLRARRHGRSTEAEVIFSATPFATRTVIGCHSARGSLRDSPVVVWTRTSRSRAATRPNRPTSILDRPRYKCGVCTHAGRA
jgi:hypothetical protein